MAIKDFAMTTARPLPVLILADTSGSMAADGKIDALNQALRDMVQSFAAESRLRAEIHLGIITFGETAQFYLPFTPAHRLTGIDACNAYGSTPLGAAMELARGLLEDRDLIPSRAFRPVLVLASDGHPTDDWETPFQTLLASERAQKATRYALAIGNDADEMMLREFHNDAESTLFHANDARSIIRFFRAVTMSVANRSRSQNPAQSAPIDYRKAGNNPDELDLDF